MNPCRFVFRRCLLFVAATLLAAGVSIPACAEAGFITASSVFDDSYRAEFAFDGEPNTRWASRGNARFPAWLQIDLGSITSFNRMVIHWETAHAAEYEIQSSENGTAWKTVLRKTDGQAGRVDLSGLAARGRYVRITALKPKGYSHVSIWELEFPESHVVPALTSARQAAAEKRARQMRETLVRVTQSGAKEIRDPLDVYAVERRYWNSL